MNWRSARSGEAQPDRPKGAVVQPTVQIVRGPRVAYDAVPGGGQYGAGDGPDDITDAVLLDDDTGSRGPRDPRGRRGGRGGGGGWGGGAGRSAGWLGGWWGHNWDWLLGWGTPAVLIAAGVLAAFDLAPVGEHLLVVGVLVLLAQVANWFGLRRRDVALAVKLVVFGAGLGVGLLFGRPQVGVAVVDGVEQAIRDARGDNQSPLPGPTRAGEARDQRSAEQPTQPSVEPPGR
jgi:hypothetical protein